MVPGVQQECWKLAVNTLLDDVWATFIIGNKMALCRGKKMGSQPGVITELAFTSPAPPSYTQPPPPYEDAVNDLPPGYETLEALAERKTGVLPVALPLLAEKAKSKSMDQSSVLKDRRRDIDIDFESTVGVREHKKKKGGANKKPIASTPAANAGGSDGAEEPSNGDGGGDEGGSGGGDAGAGGGDGGDGGDDSWGDGWATAGSKKKSKKEEEEEEAERLAKEEEERKAAEASAANNLSWADDGDAGDDAWAGVGKKKGKVWHWLPANMIWHFLTCTTERCTGRRFSGYRPERWCATIGLEFRYRAKNWRDWVWLWWLG
jgi:hypothetical protein